jgi:hypothetical protein
VRVRWNEVLGHTHRFDLPHIVLDRILSFPKVYTALEVQPELGRVPEETREAQRHSWADGPTLSKKLVHRLARNTQSGGQTRNRKTVVWEKIFSKKLARMGGWPIEFFVVRDTHLGPLSMVVADFDVIRVAVHELKTDSPLFVDRNRMLALAVTSQTMQPVARRDFQVAENNCCINLLEFTKSPGQNLRG